MTDNLKIWESIFQSNEWGKYPPVAVIKFIAKNFYKIQDRGSIKILELGCGPGANIWYLAREGFTIYGIDGSETAILNAKNRLESESLESKIGELRVGDYFNELDHFRDNCFDAVIDVESLYCNSFEKSKDIVELIFNKLKTGGVMFSLTFADGTWGFDGAEIQGYHMVKPIEGPLKNTGTGRFVTREDIEKLYKLNNNEITNIERQELHLNNNEVIKEWIIELVKK
jgi:SAM-dependent methyltransferase